MEGFGPPWKAASKMVKFLKSRERKLELKSRDESIVFLSAALFLQIADIFKNGQKWKDVIGVLNSLVMLLTRKLALINFMNLVLNA